MSAIEKNIIQLLGDYPGLSDGELSEAILGHGSSLKYINQSCRALESRGILSRRKRDDSLIGNWLEDKSPAVRMIHQAKAETRAHDISEKKIKQTLQQYLTSLGWDAEIAWGVGSSGIDIEAKRGNERWIVQVKGATSLPSMFIVNFLSVLGEIVQRMDDPNCKYSIALPDSGPFRRLWARLPTLAKNRTQVTALFVSPKGRVLEKA